MESNTKICKAQARKVIQDVMMLVWLEKDIITEKPTPELSFVPEITAEFLNNLSSLIIIQEAEFAWDDFSKNHFKRMTTTPYLFANYFACASYILIEKVRDVYACFTAILALLNHFALEYWRERDKTFLNCCVDLFCAFFDKELCTVFEDQGSWKNFSEYLKMLKCKNLNPNNKFPKKAVNVFLSRHRESENQFAKNFAYLERVTKDTVENNKEAVSFADSVRDKLKKVCKKTFEEVLKDFQNTDNEVEDLYRKTVGTISGGTSNAKHQPFTQEAPEEALENIPRKTITGKGENLRREVNTCTFLKFPVIKSQNQSNQISSTEPQESVSIPKSNAERAKKLLEEMKNDIVKMSELIKFVCEENAIKVPIQVVNPTKKL